MSTPQEVYERAVKVAEWRARGQCATCQKVATAAVAETCDWNTCPIAFVRRRNIEGV